jgi:signal transduction histidine kinase
MMNADSFDSLVINPKITCPSCGEQIDIQERVCPQCGINLFLAVEVAETALRTRPSTVIPPIAPEILVPRLGEILIERGVLTEAQLQEALEKHRKKIAAGEPRLIGQSLLEFGLVDREILDQVVTEQILQLQQALQFANKQLEQRVKERTQDLQQALTRLSELNELKSNFISTISHELRTPLTHLKGYITLLADGTLGELNETQAEAMEVMVRAEARLEHLIEDLIQFSLISRGQLSLNLKPCSVEMLVAPTIDRAAKLALARQINMRMDVPGSLPLVRVDGEKIAWVLFQLLDNAIKFTPQGGEVVIAAEAEGGLLNFSVTDTGMGISPDRIEEIFEPFHQLDSADNRHAGGTGLGLALVKRIVEGHNSKMKVHSEIGKGTRFEFTLPAFDSSDD